MLPLWLATLGEEKLAGSTSRRANSGPSLGVRGSVLGGCPGRSTDDGHKAQQHLAGLIATARRGPFLGGGVQWSVQTYAEFMAALYALMTVEAITLTEAN